MWVGFTGTRDGLTVQQSNAVYDWAATNPWDEFHHGCCYGADEEAVELFDRTRVYIAGQEIHAHPSTLSSWTVPGLAGRADRQYPEKPPLERNRDIVNASDVLLACPQGMAEEQRSGTWATVRYARKCGKPVVIFWPDGTVTREG